MNYQNVGGEIYERIIEAVGIFYEFNFWYVMAYCTLRKDFRQFRIDRILQIVITENPFSQEYGKISDHRTTGNDEKTIVKLLVDKKIMGHLVNSKKYYGLIDEVETENGCELTFETEWMDEGFPRWLITFADYADILEPEYLKIKIKDLIDRISKKNEF